MILWVVLAVIAVAVSGLLLLPLLRRERGDVAAVDYDIQVYRSQLAEVDKSAAAGQLPEAEATAARTEISRRILAADRRREGAPSPGAAADPQRRPAGQLALAGSLALVVPAAAFLLYLQLGSPGLPGHPFAERSGAAAGGQAPAADMTARGADMAALVEQLAERLARQPDDLEGWRLLSRSLIQLGRTAEAAEAFRAAVRLAPNDAQLQAGLGEALTLTAQGVVPPAARAAFDASLRADPANPRARYYRGLASAQEGDAETALERWLALAGDTPVDAPWRQVLEARIREARTELGLDPQAEVPVAAGPVGGAPRTGQAGARAEAPGQAARGPSAEDMAAAQDMSPEDREAMVESMVARLAGRLEENPDDLAGWLMLARSYSNLGRPEGERDALAKAAELDPENPEILTMYGRALRSVAGNRQTEDSLAVMRRLLAVDENSMQALWFVALGEARAGRKDEARALFKRALARVPAESPERAEMESRVEMLLGE